MIKISVTAEDIRDGEQNTPCFCPIALAIKRAIPDFKMLGVGKTEVNINNRRYTLPLIAVDFIEKFDARNFPLKGYGKEIYSLGPFEFFLEVT